MNDIPFAPGGIVSSGDPDCDLLPVRLMEGELVGASHLVLDWLASGLSLEEWKRRREQGGTDGDAS